MDTINYSQQSMFFVFLISCKLVSSKSTSTLVKILSKQSMNCVLFYVPDRLHLDSLFIYFYCSCSIHKRNIFGARGRNPYLRIFFLCTLNTGTHFTMKENKYLLQEWARKIGLFDFCGMNLCCVSLAVIILMVATLLGNVVVCMRP